MEKFDENEAAREAIASSPDVTQSVADHHDDGFDNAEQTEIRKPVHVEPSHDDLRNARLTSACLKGLLSAFDGEVDEDQMSATQELTSEGFCALSGLNPPRWLKISITLSLLLGSFTPVGVAAYQSWRNIKNG